MPQPDTLDRLFDTLDAWRHLPAFSMEPRTTMWFALWLPAAIEAATGHPCDPALIPEIPLRKGHRATGAKGANQSDKIDFLAMSTDRRHAWLVELKTDGRSYNVRQAQRMQEACDDGFDHVVRELLTVANASSGHVRSKYLHLMAILARWGVVDVPPSVLARAWRADGVRHSVHLGQITPRDRQPAPILSRVFVVPHRIDDLGEDAQTVQIPFADFAHAVPADDPLGARFRASLHRWAADEAGRIPPP